MTKKWREHKATIIRLYDEKKLSLKEVQKIMEEKYGFKASTRSYRTQFDRWGIRKYNRKDRNQPEEEPQPSMPLDNGYSPMSTAADGSGMKEICDSPGQDVSSPDDGSVDESETFNFPETVQGNFFQDGTAAAHSFISDHGGEYLTSYINSPNPSPMFHSELSPYGLSTIRASLGTEDFPYHGDNLFTSPQYSRLADTHRIFSRHADINRVNMSASRSFHHGNSSMECQNQGNSTPHHDGAGYAVPEFDSYWPDGPVTTPTRPSL